VKRLIALRAAVLWQVTAVLMTQAASPMRAYFRKMIKQLVYQAISD
jgi:hypothetical protein